MSLISVHIPEGINLELIKAAKGVIVEDGKIVFDGYTEEKANLLLNKAATKPANLLPINPKGLLSNPTDVEKEQIKALVDDSEDVSKYHVITVEATRATADTSGERIMGSLQKAAFVPAYKEGRPLLFEHDSRQGIGQTFDAWTEQKDGVEVLMVKAFLPNDFAKLPNSSDPIRAIRTGTYKAVSVSWFPTPNTRRIDEVGDDYIITNFYEGGPVPRVVELSLVSSGMHPDALVQKKFEFKNENFNTSKKMEKITYKSVFTGSDVTLENEKATQSHIEKLEKALENQKITIEANLAEVKALKTPTVEAIQHAEKTLFDRDPSDDREKELYGLSAKALQTRLEELEVMAKKSKTPLFTKVEEGEETEKPELKGWD